MPHSIRTWIMTVARVNLTALVLVTLVFPSGILAAGIPGSGVPYGIEASSDIQVGIDHFQSGKSEEAIRVFSRLIESDPGMPEAGEIYAWLGYAYLCKGWASEAKKAYSESVSLTRDPALKFGALVALGQIELDTGNYDEAAELFNEALSVCAGQEKAIVHTLLGILNYEAGRVEAAKEKFHEALSLAPSDPVPDYYIQLIEYNAKKKSVLFPTKPQLGRKKAAAKKSGAAAPDLKGVVSVNSGAKYTLTPHIKLTLGIEAASPVRGFFLSAGDDSFRWHDWHSMNIEWRLRGSEDGVKNINVVYYGEGFEQTGVASSSIILDRKPPWGSIEINGGAKYTNNTLVDLNFGVYDQLSGVAGVCLSNDGATWTDWMAYRSSFRNWQLPPGDGTKKVYACVHDGAGNISRVMSGTIIVDTVPPEIWHINVKHLSPTSVEITWLTDKDCNSAVEYRLDRDRRRVVTVNDNTFTAFHVIRLEDLEPSTKYWFKALSKDLAGNSSVSREYSFVTKAPDKI